MFKEHTRVSHKLRNISIPVASNGIRNVTYQNIAKIATDTITESVGGYIRPSTLRKT